MKIVINACHGGFGLSAAALDRYKDLSGNATVDVCSIERNDPALVQVVEEFGKDAGDCYAELNVVEVPEDVDWMIAEYDGYEHVAERHRTWS